MRGKGDRGKEGRTREEREGRADASGSKRDSGRDRVVERESEKGERETEETRDRKCNYHRMA